MSMEAIVWDNSFSVGVEAMDKQHQKLIEMVNRLLEEQKKVTDPKTIAELLTKMTEYAEVHFRAEEYLMTKYGYEQLENQISQHNEFIDKTNIFLSATDIGANILSQALLQFLIDWLRHHILEEDMKYKDFLKEKA